MKRYKKILVPTDFSKISRNALDVAVAFSESEGVTKIDSLHVFNLGNVHHKVTLPEEQQMSMAQDFANEMHQDFLEGTDLRGVEVDMKLVCDTSVPVAVTKVTDELQIDLVVTSCRGKNAISAWFLGSNAEALLEHSSAPIIAAKAKGTGRNFLETFLHG